MHAAPPRIANTYSSGFQVKVARNVRKTIKKKVMRKGAARGEATKKKTSIAVGTVVGHHLFVRPSHRVFNASFREG